MAAKKLGRNELPAGHSRDDFKCFGPVVSKDTEFEGHKLADMGCFQQEEKGKEGEKKKIDSNKYYHARRGTEYQGQHVVFVC